MCIGLGFCALIKFGLEVRTGDDVEINGGKASPSPFPRFFHSSVNPSDESLGLVENENPELDFTAGIETNAAQVLPSEGLPGDET
ncbi:hypothetical protein V6N13_037710 [Hibiscus sabdariffa]|uniref:Uncharacterized protein n=1 Tax=Hibiscus sabdariffa TaxID=183260 RepID=A0ABR2S539_9ROSI